MASVALTSLLACTPNEKSEEVSAVESAKSEAVVFTGERYQHQIDIGPLIKRFLSPQGFMDQEFPSTVAFASPYMTDFYTVQAIGDVDADVIIADFVPKYATLTEQDENNVTLTFNEGYTAVFYPQSTLVALGHKVDFSHVVLSGDTWKVGRANIADLIGKIEEMGREGAYLIPNPYYADEQTTYEQMNNGEFASVAVEPELKSFKEDPNGVLLLTEAVHGISKDADLLVEIMDQVQMDWVGLEMLNTDMQADIDEFNNAKAGTEEYTTARQKLVDYFADAWNGRKGPKTTGEENYYFKLVETAHQKGVRVVAIESSPIDFLFFRYGETHFGGSVRSLWWVNAISKTGRGAVFGGGAHYNQTTPINVQDFMFAETPERKFYAIKEFKKPKHQ